MKRILLLFSALIWTASSWGVTVQVGSGTSSQSTFPISSCWGYSYTQQIYTKAQINTLGQITKIRFYYVSGTTTQSVDWVIYLGHTTKTSFTSTSDWVPIGSLTQVYSGTVTYPATGNWMEITLTTPFNYNNADNLVVAVDENTAGYFCSINWYGFTSGTNTGIYYRSDGTNPNPASPPTASGRSGTLAQVQFDITTSDPDLTVSPGTLGFGYVPYGSSSQMMYTLSGVNLTAGPVVVTAPTGYAVSLTDGGPYSGSVNVTYTPPTLSSTSIYVKFEPPADNTAYAGNITHVGGGASKNLAVSGSSDFFSQYCASAAASNGDEDITLVVFGDNLNNSSACNSLVGSQGTATGTANLYSNFVNSIPATNVSRGTTVPITVQITQCGGGTWGHAVKVYIDFNRNGLLTDAGEEFVIWPYASSGTHTINAIIPIPVTASAGQTLLRVVCKETSSAFGPCTVSSWGETEDYRINIIMPSSMSGYVFDYNGNPVEGALVEREGGISDITDASGQYVLDPLSIGLQPFRCSKPGYNSVQEDINIPLSTNVNHNFTLLQPQMSVTPGGIFAVLGPDETQVFPLDIVNDGNGPLNWNGAVSFEYTENPQNREVTYCAAGSNSCDEFIARVQMGAIDNSSACSAGGYADYTGLSTSVEIGASYSITVTNGKTIYPSDQCGIWIDWNQNGDFADDGTVTVNGTPGVGPYTSNITVPHTALPGTTRIRIRILYTGAVLPCGNASFGEVEDYTLNVVDNRWATLEQITGNVSPFGGSQSVGLLLDAAKTPPAEAPGVTYHAEAIFTSPSGIPPVSIPITLVVTDPGLKGPQELELFITDVAEGKFMLKWKYFTIRGMQFDHFVVVRNGSIIATTPHTFYNEDLSETGEFCYKVYAVYSNGAYSEPTNEACVMFPFPPGIPISNWALLLAGLLIAGFTVFMFRRRA